MSVTIEIDNQLEAYVVVRALKEQREFEKGTYGHGAVDAIDNLLEQFEGQAVDVLLEEIGASEEVEA